MSDNKRDFCQWPKCTLGSVLIYLGAGLCDEHWTKSCNMDVNKVWEKLGIKQEAMEKCKCKESV